MNKPQRKDPNNPNDIVETGYDAVADRYGRMEQATNWPRLKWLNSLLKRVELNTTILDVGCGSGVPADRVIQRTHDLVGVDISGEQVQRARLNVPGARFMHADILEADFEDSTFSAVVSFYSIEHIPRAKHKEVFMQFHRWTVPGGYLLISIEAGDYDDVEGEWLGVPMFLSCYPPDRTKELVASVGYEIEESAIEKQFEEDHEVPYLWILARKHSPEK